MHRKCKSPGILRPGLLEANGSILSPFSAFVSWEARVLSFVLSPEACDEDTFVGVLSIVRTPGPNLPPLLRAGGGSAEAGNDESAA